MTHLKLHKERQRENFKLFKYKFPLLQGREDEIEDFLKVITVSSHIAILETEIEELRRVIEKQEAERYHSSSGSLKRRYHNGQIQALTDSQDRLRKEVEELKTL